MVENKQAAVFLDRDGTIIEDCGDLRHPGDVRFLPGVFPALRRLAGRFPLFLVTNQSGVGRGVLTMDEVNAVNRFVESALRREGAELAGVYVCPHDRQTGCRCGKPSPWFLQQAASQHRLDLAASYMVGDHPSDVAAASGAGATGIYLLTGHGLKHRSQLADEQLRIMVGDLADAARIILDESLSSPRAEADDLTRAAYWLRRGRLVAFPTETVYGLGANAYDPAAAARIFTVKQRPSFDPLIVHIANLGWLDRLARRVPPAARRLAEAFWPGPLTLVLPRRECIPDLVVSGLETVALRVPDHPLAGSLLDRVGVPLAAPSANPFGRISPTAAHHVRSGFGPGVELVLDGGPCRVGVESTIVGFQDDQPVLLRPGGTPLEDLERVAGQRFLPLGGRQGANLDRVLAPGMLPRHYAPGKPLRLFAAGAAVPAPPSNQAAGLLLTRARGKKETDGFIAVETLSRNGDNGEIARYLFAALRRLEASPATVIFAETAVEEGLGAAINDRLRRAAAED